MRPANHSCSTTLNWVQSAPLHLILVIGLGGAGCRSQAPEAPGQAAAVVREQGVAKPRAQAAPAAVPQAPGKTEIADADQARRGSGGTNAERASAKKEAETLAEAKGPESGSADLSDFGKDFSGKPGVRKVLLLGDSLAATGFGVLLEKALDAHPNIDCARRAKSATGLARPDYFDWYKQSKKAVAKHKPDLVIVILGGNDGQDLVLSPKGKGRARWKKQEWDKVYAQQVQTFVDGMSAPGRKLVWLGLPRTDTTGFETKLKRIRSVQQQALAPRNAWVRYVDTTPMVVDDQGKVKKKVRRGRRVADLRQKDGIHFTMHGSHYFAEQVYPVIVNALGLSNVKAQ